MSLTQGWVSPLDGGAAQLAPGGFYPAYPGVLGASMLKPDKNSLAMAKAARSAGSEAVDAEKHSEECDSTCRGKRAQCREKEGGDAYGFRIGTKENENILGWPDGPTQG